MTPTHASRTAQRAADLGGCRLASDQEFGTFTAVDDLDLDVPQGSFFALLGPSGLRQDHDPADGGRASRTPTAGTIQLGDQDITYAQALQASGQHRLPELRALPAPDDLRERRLRAAPAQGKSDVDEQVDEMLELVELRASTRKPPPPSSPAASSSASRWPGR